jgi:gliding motility-associated protein GldL
MLKLANQDVKVLHIESTDACNAACPQCARETDTNFRKDRQHHLTMNQILQVFDQEKIQQLDKMLTDAKIGPDLIASLGNGLKSLSENTAKMATVSNAAVATEEYSKNVSAAAKQVSTLTASYEKAATAMNSMTVAHDDVKGFTEQMKSAGKNMGALNAVYELQLQEANTRMKDTKKFYDGIQELLSNLNNTVEDTKRYKENISELANNLKSLNTVYANMLNAMGTARQ